MNELINCIYQLAYYKFSSKELSKLFYDKGYNNIYTANRLLNLVKEYKQTNKITSLLNVDLLTEMYVEFTYKCYSAGYVSAEQVISYNNFVTVVQDIYEELVTTVPLTVVVNNTKYTSPSFYKMLERYGDVIVSELLTDNDRTTAEGLIKSYE